MEKREDNLEALKASIPLDQLVELKSSVKFRREGTEYVSVCPFHSEKTGSFKVNRSKGLYYCYGCGVKGDHFTFLQAINNIEFKEALTQLKEIVGASNIPETWTKSKEVFAPMEEKRAGPTLTLDKWSPAKERLFDSDERGLEYLASRGISKETAEVFSIGYWSDGKKFKFSSSSPTAKSPWVGFPFIEKEKITFIKWRAINADVDPRFRNMSGMKMLHLFNRETIDPIEPVFVTEGELDAITIEQAGFRAVAIPGAQYKITPEDKDMLMMSPQIIIAGDNEESGTGYKAMERLMNDLGNHKNGKPRAHILMWPRKENVKKVDANSFFLQDCNGDVVEFRKRLFGLMSEACQPKSPHFEQIQELLKRLSLGANPIDDPNRMRFPWPIVDNMSLVIPGDTVGVFATTTGTGKSSFTTQFCVHNALRENKTIVFYTPDMKPLRHSRVIAAQLVEKEKIHLTTQDYNQAIDIINNNEAKIYLGFDTTASTASDAMDVCEQAVKRLGADILVIDHIHYICRNTKNKNADIENTMHRINALAEKLGIIIVVVAQSRKQQQEAGQFKNRPSTLHDIKDAAAIAEDCAAVYHLHRKILSPPDEDSDAEDYENMSADTLVRLLKGREMLEGKQGCRLNYEGAKAVFVEYEAGARPAEIF